MAPTWPHQGRAKHFEREARLKCWDFIDLKALQHRTKNLTGIGELQKINEILHTVADFNQSDAWQSIWKMESIWEPFWLLFGINLSLDKDRKSKDLIMDT